MGGLDGGGAACVYIRFFPLTDNVCMNHGAVHESRRIYDDHIAIETKNIGMEGQRYLVTYSSLLQCVYHCAFFFILFRF